MCKEYFRLSNFYMGGGFGRFKLWSWRLYVYWVMVKNMSRFVLSREWLLALNGLGEVERLAIKMEVIYQVLSGESAVVACGMVEVVKGKLVGEVNEGGRGSDEKPKDKMFV